MGRAIKIETFLYPYPLFKSKVFHPDFDDNIFPMQFITIINQVENRSIFCILSKAIWQKGWYDKDAPMKTVIGVIKMRVFVQSSKGDSMQNLLYILNLDGRNLVSRKDFQSGEVNIKKPYGFDTTYINEKTGEIKNKKFNDLYTCTLPISMDLIELEYHAPGEFSTYNKKGRSQKYYTKALINVTFSQKVTMPKNKPNWKIEKIRNEVYEKGFTVDGIEYIEFKRSSSKAREGSTLFIKKTLYDHMITWSRLNLEFQPEEEVDIASLRAYESLTLSGLDISSEMKNLIEIKRENILIIDSFIHHFNDKASVTEIEDGQIKTGDKEIEFDNDIWDGQCLVDYTLFNKAKRNDSGMMLLRNRFFKACGFNTNIKYFYKSQHVDTVYDMFGNPHNAKDIKMIITPSCLKFLKFYDKFQSLEQCYNYWLENIDTEFGICKSEKSSHYKNCNQLSYQMLNSVPLDKDEMELLAEKEIKYIKLIQNDLSAFVEHISLDDKSDTRSFISELILHNEDIIHTQLYKDFKRNTLYSYRQNVKRGKIKIPDTDYCVICCNVYEMLLATTTPDNQFDLSKQLLHGYEIYTPRYKDGQKVVGFRNPHIATGNVLLATNRNCFNKKGNSFFEMFFNFTENIVVINAIGCQIFDRLQGNDMDSDSVLLSSNPILLEKAEESQKYLTPVNRINGIKDKKSLTGANKAKIDYIISQNKIGEIVNLSQIYNSHYWHNKKNGSPEESLDKIYNTISQLSSLSQIEIDKAKKFFDTKILNTAKYTQLKFGELKDRPLFFKVVSKNPNPNREYNSYDCPMDYLQEIIDGISNAESVSSMDIEKLFTDSKGTPNKKQILIIRNLAADADGKIKAIHDTKKITEHDEDDIKRIENDFADEIHKLKLSVATIQDIIRRIYSENSKDEKIKKYKMLLLKTVAKSNINNFIAAFSAKEPTEKLEEIEYWDHLEK